MDHQIPASASGNPFAANTSHALRGDYSRMRPDYTVDQPYDVYTEEEHARWRFLYARQSALLPGYAADAFIQGLQKLDAGDAIPRLEDASRILRQATGWTLEAVPGLIPDDVFFDHLAHRRFPVAWWIRRADELDYLVEPDIFHDFFGHVPLLLDPVFAGYMEKYGKGGPKAIRFGAQKMLARLYWYMVEFGLIQTSAGLRAFGAGMLSSKDETVYSIESPIPHRIGFELSRVLSTDYMVDDFQKTYFVIDSFDDLFTVCDQDFSDLYAAIAGRDGIDPSRVMPGDRVISRGAIGG